jgi:hypothetical protein
LAEGGGKIVAMSGGGSTPSVIIEGLPGLDPGLVKALTSAITEEVKIISSPAPTTSERTASATATATATAPIKNGVYGIPDSGTDSRGFQLQDLLTLDKPIDGIRAVKPTYDLTDKKPNQIFINHLLNAITNNVDIKVTVSEPKK